MSDGAAPRGLLRERVALVTGGGGEIGGAIARRFAAEGAAVAVIDVRLAAAQTVVDEITKTGAQTIAIAADVSSEEAVKAAVAQTVARFGYLTTLVNVAATVTPDGTVETLTLEQWNTALAVNLTGVFLTCKYAMGEIRKAGGGTVVNIASQLGQIGVPRRAPYSTTKAAMIQFTKCLAVDYAQHNIRANTLSPGGVDTLRTVRRFGSREAANRARGPWHLLGRTGRVDEIAAGAVFLASEESSFMTGADLLLDGGYLAAKFVQPAAD